jgi:hypothetical protein
MDELNVKSQFAATLFDIYPSFVPTQALYLDLEGRKNGSEDVLSLYWPVTSGSERFSWLKRTCDVGLHLEQFVDHLQVTGAGIARWVVVYSVGGEEPEEQ